MNKMVLVFHFFSVPIPNHVDHVDHGDLATL